MGAKKLPEYRLEMDRKKVRKEEKALDSVMRNTKYTCPRCGGVHNIRVYGKDRCDECGELLEVL